MKKSILWLLLLFGVTDPHKVIASDNNPAFILSAVFWEKYKSETFSYAPWGNDDEANATMVDLSVGSSALSRKFVFYGKNKINFFNKQRPREWEIEDFNSSKIKKDLPLVAEFQLPEFNESTQEFVLLFTNKKKNGMWKIYPIAFSRDEIPYGSYKFISQSQNSLYLFWGDKKFTLHSGKTHVVNTSLKDGRNVVALQAMIQRSGQYTELLNQRYRHSANMRGLFFLGTNRNKLTVKKLVEFNRPLSYASGYGLAPTQNPSTVEPKLRLE